MNYSKKLKELVDDFDNNKLSEIQMVNELYEIYEEWNTKLSFEPKIRKMIKNYDNAFDLMFEDFKDNIINFFNNNAVFHTEEFPLKISVRKETINIDKKYLKQFLDKLGLTENKELETKEEIFYVRRYS